MVFAILRKEKVCMNPNITTKLKKIAIAMLMLGIAVIQPVNALPDNNSSVNAVITAEAASAIKLSKTRLSLTVGKTSTLKVTGTTKKVTWSSSKKSVAAVSSKGKITARKAGTATITAKVGTKKLTCKVTVKAAAPKLSKSTLSLNVGKTSTLTVSNTTKTITWSTSNKKVATVSSKGKITARKKGTATITAKVGTTKLTCKVTVKQPVTKVKLSKSSAALTAKGQTVTLTTTITPSNATNKAVTWKSSDTKVATVSSSGKVTAVANGTATITATSKDGSKKSATCKVTVKISASTNTTAAQKEYDEWRKKWIDDWKNTNGVSTISPNDRYQNSDTSSAFWFIWDLTEYIANTFDYGTGITGLSMYQTGHGACNASTSMILDFCKDVGIKAYAYYVGKLYPQFNNPHVFAVVQVRSDANTLPWNIADAGTAGTAGERGYVFTDFLHTSSSWKYHQDYYIYAPNTYNPNQTTKYSFFDLLAGYDGEPSPTVTFSEYKNKVDAAALPKLKKYGTSTYESMDYVKNFYYSINSSAW